METEAGNAFVSLQVGIGQAEHIQGGGYHSGAGRRGGSPLKQRFRECREAESKSKLKKLQLQIIQVHLKKMFLERKTMTPTPKKVIRSHRKNRKRVKQTMSLR